MIIPINTQMDAMKDLRLPELQEKFRDIVGKQTRSPNKTFLLRSIRSALEARVQAEPSSDPEPSAAVEPIDPRGKPRDSSEGVPSPEKDVHGDVSTDAPKPKKLSEYSIPELQALYRHTVGRETGSSNSAYLQWKIRQAQKGRIPVGPIQRKTTGRQAGDFKILPLRMPCETVEALDHARERLGLKSRMALFRHALRHYLDHAGEKDVAVLFDEHPAMNRDIPVPHSKAAEHPVFTEEES